MCCLLTNECCVTLAARTPGKHFTTHQETSDQVCVSSTAMHMNIIGGTGLTPEHARRHRAPLRLAMNLPADGVPCSHGTQPGGVCACMKVSVFCLCCWAQGCHVATQRSLEPMYTCTHFNGRHGACTLFSLNLRLDVERVFGTLLAHAHRSLRKFAFALLGTSPPSTTWM